MPRAFLIHQKTKAKKAKADSTQSGEEIMDNIGLENTEAEKFPCEIVRMPFGVSKESTCITEHTPAKSYHLIPENNKKNLGVGGNKNEAGDVPVKNNNIENKEYQLHSNIGDEEKRVVKNIKMHLSYGRSVENMVSRKIDDSLSSENTIEDRQPLDYRSTSKATKRSHGNYSILDPLHNTVKRVKLNENNNDIDVVGGDFNDEKVVEMDKDIKHFSEINKEQYQQHKPHNYEQKSEKEYSLKNPKQLLPSFNKCFQYKKSVDGWGHTIDIQSPSPPQKAPIRNSIKRESKTHYQSQPKELEKEYRKTRPYLPHPYWSPLKIEVPQFEPSPVKMARNHYSHLVHPNDSYQMCFSPSRNNTSSPNDRPLFVDSLRNQDRVSESERDTASERSCTSDQEIFRDSDSESETSSSQHFVSPIPQGPFWGGNMNNKVNEKSRDTTTATTYPHKVISPIECPKEKIMQSHTPSSSRLRLHDPHFWQNNIPNIPMVDYMRKMAPLQAMQVPENFHEYPFLPMPHYYSYLNAIEKGVFPFMPSIWRPSEIPHHPFIVNPAFMDPRYMMQYQAEKLKCHSPAYPVKHLTPSPPLYMKENLEKTVTINEHIQMVERPESIESATSDKYSTISDESSTTVDTVISSSKTVTVNENHKLPANTLSSTNTTSTKHHCEWCGKTYSTFSGLTKHKQFHCSKQVTKQFNCQHCNKEYTSLGALKMHIRTHTLPCKCHICGKAFSRPWLLQGHIRTHTGEKPFSCQHCSRAFADRSNLRAHLQTHSDVKKYSCDKCSKTFSRMSLLIKHKESGCIGNSHV